MSSVKERPVESEPTSLARAIATRIWLEQDRSSTLVAEFYGNEVIPASEAERDARVSVTTGAVQAMFDDPNFASNHDLYGFPFYEQLRHALSDGSLEGATEGQIDSISTSATKSFLDSIDNFGDAAKGQTSKLAGAFKLADEKGVRVTDVYLDEELYGELVRRSITPEALAGVIKSGIPIVDIESMLRAMTQGMIKSFDLPEDEAEDVFKELTSDPDYVKAAEEMQLKVKNLAAHLVQTGITRFWGPEVCTSVLQGESGPTS